MTGPSVPARHDASRGALFESGATSFPLFGLFPPEIRDLIWSFALPADVPELLVLQSYWMEPKAKLPLVYTAYPTLAHVCSESRAYVRSCLPLRFSEDAGCEVPCREFRPELDVFYIPASNFNVFFSRPESFFGDLAQRLEHIAIDIAYTMNELRLVRVFRYLRSLQSVTLLFAQSQGPHQADSALRTPPIRRYRTRPFTDKELSEKIRGSTRPVWTACVGKYLKLYHITLEKSTGALLQRQWNTALPFYRENRLNLKIQAQVLIEYKRTPGETPDWVEPGESIIQLLLE